MGQQGGGCNTSALLGLRALWTAILRTTLQPVFIRDNQNFGPLGQP